MQCHFWRMHHEAQQETLKLRWNDDGLPLDFATGDLVSLSSKPSFTALIGGDLCRLFCRNDARWGVSVHERPSRKVTHFKQLQRFKIDPDEKMPSVGTIVASATATKDIRCGISFLVNISSKTIPTEEDKLASSSTFLIYTGLNKMH